MYQFGFTRSGSKETYLPWKSVNSRLFLIALAVLLPIFSLLAEARALLATPEPTSLLGQLDRIGAMTAGLDQPLAQFLFDAKQVQQAVFADEPLFPIYRSHLSRMLKYLSTGADYLDESKLGAYYPLWRLLQGFSQHQEDIFSLLGAEREQTYLIVLQNTAERRPNGGFFGSFGVLKLYKGKVTHFEIVDSYLPNYDRPGTKITGPAWMLYFLPNRDIHFVGANKIGFTYFDGDHIATLYEKSYPGQQVRGVVFLRTDMFEELLPGFRKKLREWQFTNATIDLIRGSSERGKKEIYLNESNAFFEENFDELAVAMFKHLPELIEKRYINIYLTDISGPFHGLLRRGGLTTRFEEEHMYFRESNTSFNKIDMFVDKIMQITNASGHVVIETMDEIFSIEALPAGEYTATIYYSLHVPDYYRTFIRSLLDKYQIILTSREEHILGLWPAWSTRGLVYFPTSVSVANATGDYTVFSTFATPFSHALQYETAIHENNHLNEISFDFTLTR